MTDLYNIKELRENRKVLRRTMTTAEIRLWSVVKDKQLDGIKFRRQYSVGPYVLDFYSVEVRLAMELDGSVHDSEFAQEYDSERTKYLESAGIEVIRFENKEVMNNLEGVLEMIKRYVKLHREPPPGLRP